MHFRFNLLETSFFVGREKMVDRQQPRAPSGRWRKQLFIFMHARC